MLADDLKKYENYITDETVKSLSKTEFKTIVKKKVKQYAFIECIQLLDSHDKVRHIEYTDMNKAQDYITSRQFSNKQISLLFNLRCQSVRNIKNNFHTFYNNKIDCPFKCFEQVDYEEDILKCDKLVKNLSDKQKNELVEVKYQDIFGSTDEQ